MSEKDIVNKYSGYWFLKTDEERARHAISLVRNTVVLKQDGYTFGFIDACIKIENEFNKLMEESKNVQY